MLILQAALSTSAKKVPLFFYTLSIDGEGEGAAEGEVIVRVNVLDENDNNPEFLATEFHAAVQTTTEYGDSVTVLQVNSSLLPQIIQLISQYSSKHLPIEAAEKCSFFNCCDLIASYIQCDAIRWEQLENSHFSRGYNFWTLDLILILQALICPFSFLTQFIFCIELV